MQSTITAGPTTDTDGESDLGSRYLLSPAAQLAATTSTQKANTICLPNLEKLSIGGLAEESLMSADWANNSYTSRGSLSGKR